MELLEEINDIIWGPALVLFCLFTALYFSIGTRFVQIRRFREMMRLLFKGDDRREKIGTTSFQAFCIALSGRIGVGNVVGIATAIGFGGPGSIIWMWIIGMLGAATAFAESTLSQIYKTENDGVYRGSPAQYICKGLGLKRFSMVYALIVTFALGILFCPIQSHEISLSVSIATGIPMWVIGVIIAVLLATITIGGTKRIAKFSQIICPAMVIVYMSVALVILFMNIDVVPELAKDMFQGAFGLDPAVGGIIGSTITWGVKRGIYANEAGQGTGAIASGSAGVSNPVKQGLAQSFSIYIDTMIICTATAIMILACKTYNVVSDTGYIIKNPGAPEGYPGIEYTTSAIATLTGDSAAKIFVAVILFTFVFTTLISYYYYTETNFLFFLSGFKKVSKKWVKISTYFLRALLCGSVIAGSILSGEENWTLGDISVGIMVWLNLVAMVLLSPKVFRSLRDYERQKKEGKDPVFDPERLGISGTECWNSTEAKL